MRFQCEGWESWENIWVSGTASPTDAEATRRVAAWNEASPGSHQPGVGAFLSDASVRRVRQPVAYAEETVWTIVNRNEYSTDGAQMTIPHRDGVRYFDLYHGSELNPQREPRLSSLLATSGPSGRATFDVLSFPSKREATARFLLLMANLRTRSENSWQRCSP